MFFASPVCHCYCHFCRRCYEATQSYAFSLEDLVQKIVIPLGLWMRMLGYFSTSIVASNACSI